MRLASGRDEESDVRLAEGLVLVSGDLFEVGGYAAGDALRDVEHADCLAAVCANALVDVGDGRDRRSVLVLSLCVIQTHSGHSLAPAPFKTGLRSNEARVPPFSSAPAGGS